MVHCIEYNIGATELCNTKLFFERYDMKITYLQVQPNILDDINFDQNKQIQVLKGYFAHFILAFVQISILKYNAMGAVARLNFDDECLVHCGLQLGQNLYNVTHRCSVDGNGRAECHLGASKSKTYCESDVEEYVKAIAEIKCSDRDFHVNFDDNPMGLNASDLTMEQLNKFIDKLAQEKGKIKAPVFIFDCLQYLDDSVDTKYVFDRLQEIGAQVFVVAPDKYPDSKLDHKDVAVTNCHNELYSLVYLERFVRDYRPAKAILIFDWM